MKLNGNPKNHIATVETGPVIQLPDIVSVIGDESFADCLLEALHNLLEARSCTLLCYLDSHLVEVSTAGMEAEGNSVTTRKERQQVVRRHMMTVGGSIRIETLGSERSIVLMSIRRDEQIYCLRIECAEPKLRNGTATADALRQVAPVLMSIVAKHTDLVLAKPDLTPALTCLEEIESCVARSSELSGRETEVCARILYGISTYGIALDLGIGKESVMTYRKRAYARLEIASQRELLMWYLGTWFRLGASSRPTRNSRLPTRQTSGSRST